jgi:hypothetical protein
VAQEVSRRVLTAETQFRIRASPSGTSVDKMALGQVLLPSFFGFSLSVSFHRSSIYSYFIWGMNDRSAGGRSSKKDSQHIDMNNKKSM